MTMTNGTHTSAGRIAFTKKLLLCMALVMTGCVPSRIHIVIDPKPETPTPAKQRNEKCDDARWASDSATADSCDYRIPQKAM